MGPGHDPLKGPPVLLMGTQLAAARQEALPTSDIHYKSRSLVTSTAWRHPNLSCSTPRPPSRVSDSESTTTQQRFDTVRRQRQHARRRIQRRTAYCRYRQTTSTAKSATPPFGECAIEARQDFSSRPSQGTSRTSRLPNNSVAPHGIRYTEQHCKS